MNYTQESNNCAILDRKKKGKYVKCKICKKKFYVMENAFHRAKYCSRKCQFAGQTKQIKLRCKLCKKQYSTTPSQKKWRGSSFCSLECMKKYKLTKFYENKKSKKTPNAKLKKQLWGVFSEYIRQRDGGVCISCGKKNFWRKMDAGHYIPKTAGLSLYFDERNVNCQCTYCNRWMHGNLAPYAIALRKKYGEDILETLDREKRKTRKISDTEYRQLIEYYKQKTYEMLQ